MADDKAAKAQLNKIREMRKELVRMNNTLARMEMRVDQAIQRFNQNPSAQKGVGNDASPHVHNFYELDGFEGWMKSMVESYLAIINTIGIGELRSLAASLSTFIEKERDKHERASTLRYNAVLNELGKAK